MARERRFRMLGVSTAWNAHRHKDARSMVEEIKGLGVDCIELNFRLSKETVMEVGELVNEGFIKVLSLHNFCPVPDSIDIKNASPDHYSLASIDESERKKAVAGTMRTIDAARMLNAKAVVLHSGRLAISDRTRELAGAIESGADAASIANAMRQERRKEAKMGYLDSLLKSIGDLARYSKGPDIKIGLENRFYFKEMPSIDEFEVIFNNFSENTNVGYWHDTGHARIFENLGLMARGEYLKRFSSRLIGAHLHDVEGVIRDHKAPLTGKIDFSALKPHLNKASLKVLEPHAPATSEEIKRAIGYLKPLYGEE